MNTVRTTLAGLALLGLTLPGCGAGSEADDVKAKIKAAGAHDGHDHSSHAGHDHGELGPHNGHILETSDAHFHAEWTHADDGTITVYILDSSGKADHPIEAESVAIETEVEGGESKTFTLNAVGEQPATAFEIVDTGLLAMLKVAGADGATATLKFSAEGKDVTAEIKHEDHGHNH